MLLIVFLKGQAKETRKAPLLFVLCLTQKFNSFSHKKFFSPIEDGSSKSLKGSTQQLCVPNQWFPAANYSAQAF
jgi:hypothetical protein